MIKKNTTNISFKEITFITIFLFFCHLSEVTASLIEIPSTFNPVGSGARAIGTGGAFIAIADDATAASWNPGGLIQLRKPELSVVFAGFYRGEDTDFGTNPEASGTHSVSEANINYLSAAFPFELFNRNMIISLSYQHLFDFNREWDFLLTGTVGPTSYKDNWQYEQSGSLSAMGISYCIQVIPEHLSAGFTLNFWENSITDNEWEQKYIKTGGGFLKNIPYDEPYIDNYSRTEKYGFSGFNVNFGIIWDINDTWRIGAVLKTPFTADIEYERHESFEEYYPERPGPPSVGTSISSHNDELKMPMSYGIGIVYNFSDNLSLSGDIYKTLWEDFEYINETGEKTSPLTGKPVDESQTDSTYQVRIGAEYLLLKNEKKKMAVPLRGGIFYDPAPAEKSPDNYYGFSLGTGLTLNNRFSLDIAYQYRFGNNVGEYILKGMEFSQDVQEHMIYMSLILYSF